ncbi:MAG: LamG domain-containing protein [Verrucomicrobiae bacterium]|nr:LamG domain-containing protein [Verrucomicrobiae bacterium]
MLVLLLAPLAGSPPAMAAPEPKFYEPMDSIKAVSSGASLDAPTALGEGRVGSAVLLERRTENLFKDAAFADANSRDWIRLGGAQIANGALKLPQGAMTRQVVGGLEAGKLYCFSVFARASSGSGKLAVEWAGGVEPNRREFDLTSEWKRVWVFEKSVGGSATATLTAVRGGIEIEKPQFEYGASFPTSFLAVGKRGVSGLIWKSDEPLFSATEGTVSFWIKPNWFGETSDQAMSLFCMMKDPSEVWNKSKSSIQFNAWILDPSFKDWRYAMNLIVSDAKGAQKSLTIPLQELAPGWHLLILTWNLNKAGEGRIAIYVDGEARASADQLALQGLDGPTWMAVGQRMGGYLDGWLDEVRIYDRELDAATVRELSREEVR